MKYKVELDAKLLEQVFFFTFENPQIFEKVTRRNATEHGENFTLKN